MANTSSAIRGRTPKGGIKTSAKTQAQVLPNIEFDTATQQFLNSNYGSEAAWYNDPEVGPVLKAALTAGKNGTALQGQQYQDFIRTHAVDATGRVVKVAPDQSWYGKNGAEARTKYAQKLSDVGTFNENVQNTLNAYVLPVANALGTNFSQDTLQKVAESVYTNGWLKTDQIRGALLAQADLSSPATAGGDIGKAASDFSKIANDYGIPLPSDPVKMQSFIKQAVGPGGSEEAFTEYAKQIAKAQFPWMSTAIDAGVSPKAYLTPYATNIANTLDIPVDSINWQDPKWSSLLQKNDKSGNRVPSTFNDVLTQVKTDPRYGYDFTPTAINDAYDLASQIKQMFGMGQ